MTIETNPTVTETTSGSGRPDILICASEGTLIGQVKSVTDRESAERAIARLLTFGGHPHNA